MSEPLRQDPETDEVRIGAEGVPDAPSQDRPDPVTRSQRHESEIAQWREAVLSHRVPAWQWTCLGAFVVAALFAAYALPYDREGRPVIGLVVLALATLVTVIGFRSLLKQDRAVVRYAALTPVVDVAILEGEVRIVAAAADTLLKTVANPNSTAALRRLSVLSVMSAAQRVMNRGGVTAETAAVAGYAAWPGIERAEMPGNPGDFQTVHLLRIDASAKRMVDTLGSGSTPIAETFATMAGEIVPPARALLSEMGEAADPAPRT